MEWGLEQDCMRPSKFWNRRNMWSGLPTKKKFSCRQSLRLYKSQYAGSQKVFFNLVMKLFKWIEGKSTSVFFLVGSETEGIFDLGFLRNKVLYIGLG